MGHPEIMVDIGTLHSLRGWRAEVGMLAPVPGMFREWEVLAPKGVRFSSALLGLTESTVAGIMQMTEAVEAESRKFAGYCDLVCLGCTAGSFLGGEDWDQEIIKRIEQASGLPATTTSTCVLGLFKDMGIGKIALVGPYLEPIFDAEVKFFKAHGVETLLVKGLGMSSPSDIMAYGFDLDREYRLIKEAARAAPDADGVFATCMATSLLGIVDTLEDEIKKPVISSPSATLYGILKKLGIPDPISHYGQVLRRPRC